MKIIDMTQTLYHNCPGWFAYANAEIGHETVVGVQGYTSERLNINTHTATHLDAPSHFYPGLDTIDKMPLEKFVGKAIIVDMTGVEPDYGITPKDLEAYESLMEKDCIVLINTGWCKKRGYGEEYYKMWPYLTGEGAKWCRERGAKGVGIDSMSLGAYSNGRPAHSELLPYGVWIIEEVNFPDEIKEYKTVNFVSVPLKLEASGGSPTRAYAIVDNE